MRPIVYDDVAVAATLVHDGSLTPEVEQTQEIDAYWKAVIESRACRGEVFVAQFQLEVVGICQVIIFPHFQHTGGWCCELESVHVRRDLRSRGIGSLLVRRAEALARERGCYRVQLTSRNVRADAHRFYRANGYQQTSQGFKKLVIDPDFT